MVVLLNRNPRKGHFTDLFTKSEYSHVPLLDRSAPFMEDIVVTKEGVTKLLKGLNPFRALGPDELHPRVLMELTTELGPILAHLFQQSIDSGEIPKEWTLANISPLFKKGDRSLACNYRPVSLTCVPCKLLEHILWSNIMALLYFYLFIQYFKRVTHLAVIAILSCGPLCKHIYIYTNTKVI